MKTDTTPFDVYELHNATIAELIDEATLQQAVIPSIQRPFVWQPHQIARLVDSLLHGWPCGSLLFWQTDHAQQVFPVRPFACHGYSDETGPATEAAGTHTAPYRYMVLDGQQRLQSLVLAFAPESEGFTCTDIEWHRDLGQSGGKRISSPCKLLCFNLSNWPGADECESRSFLYLDCDEPDEACLVWKTRDEINENRASLGAGCGALIPLNRVLSLPATAYQGDCQAAWAWLRDKVAALMQIQISTLIVKGMADNVDREEAIVTMFTRLNTSGTPLTREQILSAKIKQAWHAFPARLAALQDNLFKASFTVELDDDELVRGFNILALAHIGTRDLKLAYNTLSARGEWEQVWDSFARQTTAVLGALYERFVRLKTEFRSMYVIWYAVALCHLQHLATGREFKVDDALGTTLVKWVFVTLWGKIWANRSGQWVKKLNGELLRLRRNMGQLGTDGLAQETLQHWLADARLVKSASDYISNLMASARGSVRDYYTPLWVWMRLGSERADLLRAFASGAEAWDVDHLVPAKWGADTPELLRFSLNSIGNCWLLSHKENIKKGKKDMASFLQGSSCPSSLTEDVLAELLDCSSDHIGATAETDLGVLADSIRKREESIKTALKDYIARDLPLSFISPSDQFDACALELYRGREFAQWMQQGKRKRVNTYLYYVSRAMSKAEITAQDVQDMAERGARQAFDAVSVGSGYRSAWSLYADFLLGKVSPAASRRSREDCDCYMLEEFLSNIENRKLKAGSTELQARKDKNNHRSYVKGYYKSFEDITYERIEALCAQRDTVGLRQLKRRYRHPSSGYHGGWERYIDFLENEVLR